MFRLRFNGTDSLMRDLGLSKYKPGDVFELNGFQSTSIDPEIATKFARASRGSTIMEIMPKRGAYIDQLSGATIGGKREREFLLPANARYRIVGRKKVKGAWGGWGPYRAGRVRTKYGYEGIGSAESAIIEVLQVDLAMSKDLPCRVRDPLWLLARRPKLP